MFSIIRTLIAWSLLGLVSAVFTPIILLLYPWPRTRLFAFAIFCRISGRFMVALAGGRLPGGIRKQMDAVQPAIFVSNHTSYLDNFILCWAGPLRSVALAQHHTLFVPFFGHLYALSGNVLVDRKERRSAVAALHRLAETMQRYRLSAVLWPEGGRAQDGRLRSFKRGFVHLAMTTRLPIVPVVVTNAHRCWPKGSFYTHFTKLNVQVLPPIPTDQWSIKTIDQHVAEVRAQFVAALPPDQRPATTDLSEVAP